ncbi:hypothetical protein [Rhodovulum steppense]|uniref:Uncharacterized protein n=1 Tax=Rhodovulum steppense TaxID=540251 RepID=A0A4R1YLU2_9RHOB|nr:hypothetical protein [Rhodovulum steppense]TCM78370.1 hypothetical protein EV216_12647 [Rhodovulum steppense]
MNKGIRMGDRLKTAGAGNLFVMSGAPGIATLPRKDGGLRGGIRGMDILDPVPGEGKAPATPRADIACRVAEDVRGVRRGTVSVPCPGPTGGAIRVEAISRFGHEVQKAFRV